MKKLLLSILSIVLIQNLLAQTLSGVVYDDAKIPVRGAVVSLEATPFNTLTTADGGFSLVNIPAGSYTLIVQSIGLAVFKQAIRIPQDRPLQIALQPIAIEEVVIIGETERQVRLQSIEQGRIFEAKKNELIILKDIHANFAVNNARQIFAKVSGLNVWENDNGGIQLAIGARGLNPNRAAEFNIRQNNYDIAADPLGYPDAYYTPPADALDRIEVVRGAASLQYGTQFGGLVNFVMHKPTSEAPFLFNTRTSVGSFGLFNTFNSIEGSVKRFSYTAFYQKKLTNGWRPNTNLTADNAYLQLSYQLHPKWSVQLEYTLADYLIKQPGGLTDADFKTNPQQSLRERNWFAVHWHIPALSLQYQATEQWFVNVSTFGLIGSRDAIGYLRFANRTDDGLERDLLKDTYRNFGAENRNLFRYRFLQDTSALAFGFRYFKGSTNKRQGLGDASREADFDFVNPENLTSDYDFPNENMAFFAENVLRISPKLTITPGFRIEHIRTQAQGYFSNSVSGQKENKNTVRTRFFPLFGIGVSYKPQDWVEIYGNFSQNYRAINFTDLRIINPNVRIDENIQDEKGFNADLGVRGRKSNLFNYDANVFLLAYRDRIGNVQQRDENFNIFRYRTNLADSRSIGVELQAEADFWQIFEVSNRFYLPVFVNILVADARYVNTPDKAVQNKKVEYAPTLIFRSGISGRYRGFSFAYQFSYTSEQFADATNAVSSPTAIVGLIPAYWVMDLSMTYRFKTLKISTGINNLTDRRYFTRRAESYPGPGIVPAEARSIYLTLDWRIGVKPSKE
jgi:Fe(3+) dicitrate transport protein